MTGGGGGGGGAGRAGASGGDEMAGAAARAGAAATAAGSGKGEAGFAGLVSLSPLRLPNTSLLQAAYFFRSLAIRGESREPRGFLVSLRPVSRCAICRNISVVRWPAENSAIIWPLLAAEPNICGSKGMLTIGWLSIALANSATLISGRFGTPTWFRQYSGGRSLGRDAFRRSKMFLVLRRLARSGAATIRISSAPTRARFVHPDHWWGTSSTIQGMVARSVSKIASNASTPKSYTLSSVAGAASKLKWSVHFDNRRSMNAV